MKNSKSPHRPPEISPRSFSFPQKNPQGNIISRQIRRKFRMSEPTVPMHGNAITPHMIRKQYNPTGQVTFFRTIHEKKYRQYLRNTFSEHKKYALDNTPRTIKQRAIHTRGSGTTRHRSLPRTFMSALVFSEYCFTPAKLGPGNPSTIGPPPHPAEAAHARGRAPPRHPHREKPSQ